MGEDDTLSRVNIASRKSSSESQGPLTKVTHLLSNRLRVFLRTGMPLWLAPILVSHAVRERFLRKRYRLSVARFTEASRALDVSTSWFLSHTAKWFWLFDSFELRDKPLRILEIGSWEGLSTYFLLSEIPGCTLVAVDTWQGSDENEEVSEELFATFNQNIGSFQGRVHTFVGKSEDFFETGVKPGDAFDLIYVDGSHRAEDVRKDAENGFPLLREGGLMVFDDFFWQFYPNPKDNPAAAINDFMKANRTHLDVVDATYQVTVRKRVS